MEEPAALRSTLEDVIFMETAGMRPVLVHGGGKAIDRAMAASGLQPRKIQGRRYTDDDTLRIVVDTLLNDTNAGIVGQIRELGGRAVGLHSGCAAVPLWRTADASRADGKPIDLGQVGQVTRVDGQLIEDFCAGRVVPVIPSLALDADGRLAQRQRRHRRRGCRRPPPGRETRLPHRHARHPARSPRPGLAARPTWMPPAAGT